MVLSRRAELAKQAADEAHAPASAAVATVQGSLVQAAPISKDLLPKSLLAKHPKGCGMDLVFVDALISTIGLFHISNL